MRDKRGRLALSALRSRNQGGRLRISRVRFLSFNPNIVFFFHTPSHPIPPSHTHSSSSRADHHNPSRHRIHFGLTRGPCDAHRIWRWRNQYGEVLGGLGTGIGDADRGVECARGKHCLSGKYIEHETDCDADDAREAEGLAAGQGSWQGSTTLSLYSGSHSWSSSHSSLHGGGGGGGGYGSSSSNSGAAIASSTTPTGLLDGGGGGSRTPSPAVGPGYARHEVEGIGNKIKTVRVSMIRIGGCVPEWKDEKVTGQSLQREVSGEVRSWCGWCERPVPGRRDLEAGEGGAPSAASSPLTATSPM